MEKNKEHGARPLVSPQTEMHDNSKTQDPMRAIKRTIVTAWLYCPEQVYISTHPGHDRFTCWDVMVAQGIVFLSAEQRAALTTFEWLGQQDAQIDWNDASFLEQVFSRLKDCARDNLATTPCLYKN